jgi:glutamate decarboxylase
MSIFAFAESQKAQGRPYDRPNIVMHSTVHVSWKKAALFLDIEVLFCSTTDRRLNMCPTECVGLVNENTMLVTAVLGSLYTGAFDDVEDLSKLLDKKCQTEGLDVGIHVDAASGGFIAPFACPELIWDFRLPRVRSINMSGHKCKSTAIVHDKRRRLILVQMGK